MNDQSIASTRHERTPEQWLDWLLGLDRRNQLTAMRRFLDWRRVYRAHRLTPVDQQTWERPTRSPAPGPRAASTRLHLEVEQDGRARVHEAVLAQLLTDAGWERTA